MLATLQLTYFDFVRELIMSFLAYTFTWLIGDWRSLRAPSAP